MPFLERNNIFRKTEKKVKKFPQVFFLKHFGKTRLLYLFGDKVHHSEKGKQYSLKTENTIMEE